MNVLLFAIYSFFKLPVLELICVLLSFYTRNKFKENTKSNEKWFTFAGSVFFGMWSLNELNKIAGLFFTAYWINPINMSNFLFIADLVFPLSLVMFIIRKNQNNEKSMKRWKWSLIVCISIFSFLVLEYYYNFS